MPVWLGRIRNAAVLWVLAYLRRRVRVTIDERRLTHIFRAADGHFSEDSPETRHALLRVASNPAYRRGEDRFGATWAEETLVDGRQVWVQIRNGRIINGGIRACRQLLQRYT
jgi:hypothetical protein